MSRIGKQPVQILEGVKVEIEDSKKIVISGPKGSLEQNIFAGFKISQDNQQIVIEKIDQTPLAKQQYGLLRSLVNNMVIGVSQGFSKVLEVKGVGFKANMEGKKLNLSLGYSHKIVFEPPEGIELKAENNIITVSGYDKQLVGEAAAQIRSYRKPEPYKGKGIKYSDEHIRRKVGKTGVKAT
jgi:large subunit ribosomal protein L6